MLKIRLRRTGKRNQPYYRIVVAEHTAPITGKFVAIVGHYNPRSKELVASNDEILQWLGQGAKPSNTVARLLIKHGLKHKQLDDAVHVFAVRPSKKQAPEAAAQDTPAEAPVTADEATPAEAPAEAEAEATPKEEATEESTESTESSK